MRSTCALISQYIRLKFIMKNFDTNSLRSPKAFLEKISKQANLPEALERRRNIVEQMSELNSKGLDCFNCSGMCCTHQYNSMQVDPVQALELLAWLESEGRLNEDLIEDLEEVILEYRLNKDFMIGRNREFRRKYTCPFFMKMTQGCSISRAVKPYGCLAFNPLEKNVSTEGKCASNLDVLIERESRNSEVEDKANELISKELGLYWKKKSMPFAIQEIIKGLLKP